jgi:hypothetical protein
VNCSSVVVCQRVGNAQFISRGPTIISRSPSIKRTIFSVGSIQLMNSSLSIFLFLSLSSSITLARSRFFDLFLSLFIYIFFITIVSYYYYSYCYYYNYYYYYFILFLYFFNVNDILALFAFSLSHFLTFSLSHSFSSHHKLRQSHVDSPAAWGSR